MADTWPEGDALERGGSASGGGFLSGIGGFLGTVGKGVQAGVTADTGRDVEAKVKPSGVTGGLVDRVRGLTGGIPTIPGAGDLWTYDNRTGVAITGKGWIVLGVAAGGAFLLFSGGRR
jgi:hypothetical protein